MNTTIVSSVWLALLRAQKPMKHAEIVKALPELPHSRRGPVLNVAYRLGYIERAGKPRQYQYSVTPRCCPPPGVLLHEILEAVN